ncbi:MAG: NADH-quinone oxidoreductase subunit M [Candidatus Aminicenantes bacterium]|nr:NADH-quinone oxidoreductase subunit M [Candidatus Aminicenantes bacterium]
MISAIVFVPLFVAILYVFIPGENKKFFKIGSLSTTILVFLASLWLFVKFNPANPLPQFVELKKWIGFGLNYRVGADGISLMLLILTTFLMPLAVASSWNYIKEREKEYYIMLLLLETGMLGVFVAQNLFLFYIFWEAMLIPMYFLIGIWGGEKRVYATVKFVLYTMLGSLLMLVGIFYLWKISPEHSLYFYDLYSLEISPSVQILLFAAFGLAFAIKVPLFPFHTWLPDAHTEAPTAGSVLLAGVLLKMGGYGFLRLAMPIFPEGFRAFFPYLIVLAVISIIYGAAMAFVQKDAKRLVAYSSVSHLGVVMLGIFILTLKAYTGGIYQMLNHGLSTGALFLLVGMIYERTHTREMEKLGGLARPLPVLAGFLIITVLSSIGLPGLNGFIGEFLVFIGTFEASKTVAAFAALGIILSAVYLLWMYQRVMQGKVKNADYMKLPDMNLREILIMVPIVILYLWMGLYPKFFISKFEKSAKFMLEITNKPQIARVIQGGGK